MRLIHNTPADSRLASRPVAIVLCSVLTGLATVRALAGSGVPVHALIFDPKDPLRTSRYPQRTDLLSADLPGSDLVKWICERARLLPVRPVVLATSDKQVLTLAEHADELATCCQWVSLSMDALRDIIEKHRLYALAEQAGVPVLPWRPAADLAELHRWLLTTPGPYLVKPSYNGKGGQTLKDKNRVYNSAAELLQALEPIEREHLLVQPLVRGGDGHIFDTYGCCDAQGRVMTLATHTRLRQHPPHLGTTTYGEIPAQLPKQAQGVMEDHTLRLLAALPYHGIFGIEWLRDRASGQFYLIDFNARPFSSIGHLVDSGLNLPLLTYLELIGQAPADLSQRPRLKHRYWIDLLRDTQSLQARAARSRPTWSAWILDLLRVRSSAYASWRDPGPFLKKLAEWVWFVTRWACTRPPTP